MVPVVVCCRLIPISTVFNDDVLTVTPLAVGALFGIDGATLTVAIVTVLPSAVVPTMVNESAGGVTV